MGVETARTPHGKRAPPPLFQRLWICRELPGSALRFGSFRPIRFGIPRALAWNQFAPLELRGVGQIGSWIS